MIIQDPTATLLIAATTTDGETGDGDAGARHEAWKIRKLVCEDRYTPSKSDPGPLMVMLLSLVLLMIILCSGHLGQDRK